MVLKIPDESKVDDCRCKVGPFFGVPGYSKRESNRMNSFHTVEVMVVTQLKIATSDRETKRNEVVSPFEYGLNSQHTPINQIRGGSQGLSIDPK